eukprot:6209897-Pleurochrysis_carterae.AAC.1
MPTVTQQSLARERAQARGLGVPTGRLRERGAHGPQQQPSRARVSKSLGSGARSAPKVHMRRGSDLRNCAYKCQNEVMRGARDDSCK